MNQLRSRNVATGLALALSASFGLIAASGNAQTTAPKDVQVMDKFEVTGTRLTGAAAEGALSVSAYKIDAEISLQGYGSVAEMLRRKLPQFGGGIGTYNESYGNGGSGESTISLRNLPLSRALFLVNGRRTNMDMNLIPDQAIERVEILNDGASAIYGTDAVAGVVNVILKKNYQGAEFFARYGNTTENDISERRFGMTAGGKVGKTSVTVSAEFGARNTMFSIDRAVSIPSGDSVSGTSNPGLFTPIITAAERSAATASGNALVALRWTVNPANSTGLTAANQVPAAFNPNVVLSLPVSKYPTVSSQNAARDAEEARLNGLLPANSPVRYGNNPVLLPGLNGGFPYGYYTYAVRPREHSGFVASTVTEISKELTFFADLSFSRNYSENALAPSPLSGRQVTPTNYWYKLIFPAAANAGRSYTFGYRPVELGPRLTQNRFEDARIVAGFKGKIDSNWEYEVAYTHDQWKLNSLQTSGVYAAKYAAALADSTNAAFNPFGYTKLYGTSSPVNPDSLIKSFYGEAATVEKQKLHIFDANVKGNIFDLPAGKVAIVVGAEHRKFTDDYIPDEALINGDIFPFNIDSKTYYSRKVTSGYVETEIPVVKSFTIPLAARYEEFSDVGGTGIKPRVAFRWEPIAKELTIRGSWAKGFVAPSLGDLDANAPAQDFTELYNPVTKIRTQPEEGVMENGNPNLKPAKSDSYLIGFVHSPKSMKGLSYGANYYRIDETNIPFQSAQYIVNQWFAAGPTNANNPYGENAKPSAQNPLGSQVELTANGDLYQVRNIGPINTGERSTDGVDLFAMYQFDTQIGTFKWDASWTRVLSFEMEDFPGAGKISYLNKYWGSGSAMGDYGFPKWKGNTAITWNKDRWMGSVSYNYVDGYLEDENDNNKVEAYQTFDVRLSYRLPKWDVQVNVGCNNVLDEQPPYLATSFENQHDRAITDIRGRVWFIELSKKF